jgi:hypothetical protein
VCARESELKVLIVNTGVLETDDGGMGVKGVFDGELNSD